jgi:hypothetical protein
MMRRSIDNCIFASLPLFAFAGALAACSGGSSDSTIREPDAGDGGSPANPGASLAEDAAGASASGSSSGGTSSVSSDAAATQSSDSEPEAGTCQPQTNLVQATRITLSVSWPATLSGNGGSGPVDIWLLADLVAGTGGNLTGNTRICGVTLPSDVLNGAGQLVTGGTKVLVTLPAALWNAPSMPTFGVTGTTEGWSVGSAISFTPVVALIGLRLPDADIAWPSSTWSFPSATSFPDDDGDGKPGITAIPLSTAGYTLPPTGLGALGSAPTADKIYVALRSELALSGHRTSCADVSGTATVKYFDNHVVGCHVYGGSDCTTGSANTQADFVDQARTLYQPGSATFEAKVLSPGADCGDALSALPAM